jgi:hypothetical protein
MSAAERTCKLRHVRSFQVTHTRIGRHPGISTVVPISRRAAEVVGSQRQQPSLMTETISHVHGLLGTHHSALLQDGLIEPGAYAMCLE